MGARCVGVIVDPVILIIVKRYRLAVFTVEVQLRSAQQQVRLASLIRDGSFLSDTLYIVLKRASQYNKRFSVVSSNLQANTSLQVTLFLTQ